MATKLIPGIGYVDEDRSGQYLIPGAGSFDDPGIVVAATSLSLTGPSVAEVAQPSANFVVTVNGTPAGSVVVTPNDGNQGGAFTPSTVTLSSSVLSATFTYTASSSGTKTVNVTNNSGLDNPGPITVDCTADPQGQITSVTVNGQKGRIDFTFSENPVSGVASFIASATPNGAVTQGPKPVTLSPSTGTGHVEFDLPPGDYDQQTVTLSNTAGNTVITSNTAIKVIGVDGSPQAPGNAPPATVPGVPTNVVATAGNGTASVNCTPPSDGGSPITGYQVIASTGQSASSPTLPVSIQMPNGVPVTFQIRAVNSIGQGGLSQPSNSVTPSVPITVPGAPVIGAAAAGNGYIDVYFTPPASNGGSPITHYTALLSTGESVVGASSPIRVAASNGTARTATVTATNLAGTSMPSQASNAVTPSVGITVPDAPTVSLVAGVESITATVTPPTNNGGSPIVSYTVTLSTGESKTQSGNPFVFNTLSLVSRTATAIATSAIGNSAPSGISNAVTPIANVPVPIDLAPKGVTRIEIRTRGALLQIALAMTDSPAPNSRTIVLGSRKNTITS